VAERRRLGLLQVGLVGHQRLDVLRGDGSGAVHEVDDHVDEVQQLVAQVDPQGDPCRFPTRSAGVQPARGVAEARYEQPLAGVVGLAELGVVGELGGISRLHFEQQPQQIPCGGTRNDASAQQIQHVGNVGEVEPGVQERGVRVLQREAAVDELRRR
jgi:hypothetical protein